MLSIDLNAPEWGTLATLIAIVVSVGVVFLARALQKRDDAMKGLDAEDKKTVKKFLKYCSNLRSELAILKIAIVSYDEAESSANDAKMSYVDTMDKSLDKIQKILVKELNPAFTEISMVKSAEIRTNANNLYNILYASIEGDAFDIDNMIPQVAEQTIDNIDNAIHAFSVSCRGDRQKRKFFKGKSNPSPSAG